MRTVIWRVFLCIFLLGAAAAPGCGGTEAEDEGGFACEILPPDTDDAINRRRALIEQAIMPRIIDDTVTKAMLRVPRHAFVPESHRHLAYNDHPLPIGYEQTISQPLIVAIMTELLELEEGQKVLEIGTGSGYQAAVLAEITDHVYSIEILEPLAKRAARTLECLGYDTVEVLAGDGYKGWEEHAPYDAIIVTAAPPFVPQPLLDQLSPDRGRMVIPVGEQYQELKLIVKTGDDVIEQSVLPVRFVPMVHEEDLKK